MKIDLNADYRSVCKRLAEKENAGVAQVGERLLRTQEAGTSNVSTSPKLNAET